MKYLVTGGAGFLGSNLCQRLLDIGDSVVCLDDLSTGKRSNIKKLESNLNFLFVEHDLTKPYFPEDIDAIFNLACPASPVHYQYNPIRTLKMGTLAMYNVLGMAAKNDVPILQASTSEIYGDPLEHPQSETYRGNVNPIGPRACYDEGKRVAESLCVAYHQYSGVKIRIARIFNTYGPYMDKDDGRVISNFVTQALQNKPITVYGDGSQTRSFCFVDDLVDGLMKLMNSDYNLPVNLGNPEEYSIKEVSSLIKKVTESSSSIVYKELPKDDPAKRRPDISLAKQKLSWEPTIPLKVGLEKTVAWFEKQLEI